MGIHIRHRDNPVEVVVFVDVGAFRKAQFTPPAIDKTAPEEVAYRDAVCLFMTERLVDSFQLGETAGCSVHGCENQKFDEINSEDLPA
jgi:hypothetical protein